MRTWHERKPRAAMLLGLTLLTAACSTPSTLPAAPPTIPPLPAELMQSESESSRDYSQRVLDWLQRVRSELGGLMPKSPDCKTTRLPSQGPQVPQAKCL